MYVKIVQFESTSNGEEGLVGEMGVCGGKSGDKGRLGRREGGQGQKSTKEELVKNDWLLEKREDRWGELSDENRRMVERWKEGEEKWRENTGGNDELVEKRW